MACRGSAVRFRLALLVIVDSYAKSVPKGTSEKDEGFAEPLYESQEFLAPSDATTIVMHHSGRAESNSAIKLKRNNLLLLTLEAIKKIKFKNIS